jgi:ectoine hydroxylase-related dioxygenase (phytanoyl-CoA dioxygenase family)
MPADQAVVIELAPDEVVAKRLGSHNLQAAIEALHRDGLVVLRNCIDTAHLDKLNARMVPEAKKLYVRPETARNFGPRTGNIQQEPVLEAEFIFDDIIANPWATQVTQCMFGPQPQLRFYSANTAFKATDRQPPHIDVNFAFPRVPFGYCININLVDTSPENGSTEVWLGTHTDTDQGVLPTTGDLRIRDELVERRRAVRPPIQPSLPKGSLIIRDFRLWHAGRPNTTDEPRVMLVTVQFPSWYRSDLKMTLPSGAKDKVDWGDLVPYAEWVDQGYDYLKGAHDHDFVLLP